MSVATGTTHRLYLGTAKGLHIFQYEVANQCWKRNSRELAEYDLSALSWDKRTPKVILAGTSDGNLLVSRDGGLKWELAQISFPGQKIWSISPDPHSAPGGLYIGVDGGHLYYSPDNGASCAEATGLRNLPGVDYWFGPFGPAIFHSVLPVPGQPGQIYAGLSVVGVLVSHDSGQNWHDATANLPRVPNENPDAPQLSDVHKLGLHPQNPARMYTTTHFGTFRSDDGSQTWQNISEGLPFLMTRPLALHPTDPDTVYVITHEDTADNELPIIRGTLQVYRSRDAGRHWQPLSVAIPKRGQCSVLREALVIDEAHPAWLYLGTNGGQVFISPDEGDSWQLAAEVDSSIRVIQVHRE